MLIVGTNSQKHSILPPKKCFFYILFYVKNCIHPVLCKERPVLGNWIATFIVPLTSSSTYKSKVFSSLYLCPKKQFVKLLTQFSMPIVYLHVAGLWGKGWLWLDPSIRNFNDLITAHIGIVMSMDKKLDTIIKTDNITRRGTSCAWFVQNKSDKSEFFQFQCFLALFEMTPLSGDQWVAGELPWANRHKDLK